MTDDKRNPESRWRWGVPDWKDAGAYPSPDATPLNVWRWQFLRRRYDYREDWLLHFKRNFERQVAEFAKIACPEGVSSWQDHFSHSVPVLAVGDKYGTQSVLHDPALDRYPIGLFRSRGGILRYASEARHEERRREMLMAYVFDLKEPLPEQLTAARRHLRRIRDELGVVPVSRRRQVTKWPLYLRLLDARDAGATFEQIGTRLIDADPEGSVPEYDDRAGLEPKSWAKKRHDQALEVAFSFPI